MMKRTLGLRNATILGIALICFGLLFVACGGGGTTTTTPTDEIVNSICDSGLPSNSSNALDYAKAMEMCLTTSEPGAGQGVISATLTLSSGSGVAAASSRAIRGTFGTNNAPLTGAAMVVLSTGAAAAPGQASPAFAAFQPGSDTGTSSAAPADWLAANGGAIPVAPGCPAAASTTAVNPVMLTLRIRVPSNAHSFSISTRFFSADYPEYVCSPYNDNFVALLDSTYAGANPNPTDKNLAKYVAPSSSIYPLGVNLAVGNTGLFTQCVNGSTGCAAGATAGSTSSCTGTYALAGTGMDTTDSTSCAASTPTGGGTEWIAIRGNVVPGEIITLRFALWDTGDSLSDSVVLLDNFAWSTSTVTPGASLH